MNQEERRTPRSTDDLFWFNEAKKAYGIVDELRRECADISRILGNRIAELEKALAYYR